MTLDKHTVPTKGVEKMQPGIVVEIRNVYGEDKVYPVCEHAKIFADIAGTKTLTEDTLDKIESLGYELILEHKKSPLAARLGVK
tara:strand:- start:744 stop:995 length:252 start_codon:yes stop_codon:yes gene_type:complete